MEEKVYLTKTLVETLVKTLVETPANTPVRALAKTLAETPTLTPIVTFFRQRKACQLRFGDACSKITGIITVKLLPIPYFGMKYCISVRRRLS